MTGGVTDGATDGAAKELELLVNGVRCRVTVDSGTTLLNVLRGELGLTGTRFGCGSGLCGACFVLVDGSPIASCDLPASAAVDASVVTVEGLSDGDRLHPVQRAFIEEQAAQCGYCVSGILISAAALLAANPTPDEPAVLAALERHLCRCGAQRRMVKAVLRA